MPAIDLGSFSRNQTSVWSNDLPKVTQSGFGPGSVYGEPVSYLAYGRECRLVNNRCVFNQGMFLPLSGKLPWGGGARAEPEGWAGLPEWGRDGIPRGEEGLGHMCGDGAVCFSGGVGFITRKPAQPVSVYLLVTSCQLEQWLKS